MTRKWLVVVVAVVGALSACADDVGDVNRVQPDYYKKTDFQGTWYLRDVITKMPPTSSIIFAGYTGELEKVRWVVTRDALMAYRAYELIPGQERFVDGDKEPGKTRICDPKDATKCEDYYGAPVAAYAITDHFDIQREYNPATGEQTNVIVENSSDRPWYDRAFMRVDWSTNKLTNYTQLANMLAKANIVDSIRYVERSEDEKEPVHVESHAVTNDKGERVEEVNYLDFTGRFYVKPLDCGYGPTDCTAAEMEVRTSMYKVPDSDYEPLFYDDRMLSKFGYFRTERLTYNKDYGLTESGRVYLANRHNVWKQNRQPNPSFDAALPVSRDNPKTLSLPLVERSPKPIVYFLNPEFPSAMLVGAYGVEASWDRAFRRSVAAAWGAKEADLPRYDCTLTEDAQARAKLPGAKSCTDPFAGVVNAKGEAIPQMFYVCQVPVTKGSPEACKVGRAIGEGDRWYDPMAAAETWTPRVGDVRYSFLYWIADPQLAGPLGYGPASADPETGEVISAGAYIYGAALDTYAQSSLDMIDLLNGDLKVDDVTTGQNIQDYIQANRDALDPRKQAEKLPREFLELPAGGMDRDLLKPELRQTLDRLNVARGTLVRDLDPMTRTIEKSVKPEALVAQHKLLVDRAPFAPADSKASDRLQQAFASSPLMQRALEDDEFKNAVRAAARTEEGQAAVFKQIVAGLSGDRTAQQRRLAAATKDNVWLAEFSDDAIAGLALELQKELKKQLDGVAATDPQYAARRASARAYVRDLVENRVFQAVAEHEVGHTFGLRHNFQGSYDALNYPAEYWLMRKENLKPLRVFGTNQRAGLPDTKWMDITVGDMLDMAAVTPAQAAGKMPEYKYSSIMDYGSRFNSDIHGIGRYDEAAILFAYSGGDGQPGVVEVFKQANLPKATLAEWENTGFTARTALRSTEYHPNPLFDHLTEEVHYTRLPELFAKDDGGDYQKRLGRGINNMLTRTLVPYGEVVKAKSASGARLQALDTAGKLDENSYLEELNREDRPFEVPYMFCSDEYAGQASPYSGAAARLNCQRWDEGADYYEQTHDIVNRYLNYYWFTNFKRDRYGWSPYSVGARVMDRYFSYLPTSYQNWLWSQYSGGGLDRRASRYWTLGVLEGYNLLSNVLAAPSDGVYGYDVTPATGEVSNYRRYYCAKSATAQDLKDCEDAYLASAAYNVWYRHARTASADDGTGQNKACVATVEPQPTTTKTQLDFYNALPQAEKDRIAVPHIQFVVPKGAGRPVYSRFDYNSGYYLFDKVQEAGSFWEQLAAMQALIQNQTNFVGVETASDARRFSIPYYLAFPDSVSETFSGVYTEEHAKFAPRVVLEDPAAPAKDRVGTGFQYRVAEGLTWIDEVQVNGQTQLAWVTYPAAPDANAPVLQTPINWTQQFYAAVYSMIGFNQASWSINFADQNKIFRLGAGEALTANAGYEQVTFEDPFRGHIYVALKDKAVTDPAKLPPAVVLINKANDSLARYKAAKAKYDANVCDLWAKDDMDDATQVLNSQVDFMNVMRGLYDLFGKNI